MKVFARQGYHRAKMGAVAAEAGIGKGTIYEYFGSKTDLFLALYDHMISELKNFYMQELAGIDKPAILLDRLISVAFQTFRLWEPFFLVFFDFWAEGGRGEHHALIQTRLSEAYAASRNDMAAIIAAGVEDGSFCCDNPLLAASAILASLDGLVLQWLCDRNAFKLDAICEHFTQSTLRSLRS